MVAYGGAVRYKVNIYFGLIGGVVLYFLLVCLKNIYLCYIEPLG